ncbi:hypothetical protein O3P69_003292 [Scylla paramamosain]|uniref:Uncharacterized protein n=1 Tax=Scylla paramamosain TaxID=85552 RepID=A0AAW0UKY5_SCYPA
MAPGAERRWLITSLRPLTSLRRASLPPAADSPSLLLPCSPSPFPLLHPPFSIPSSDPFSTACTPALICGIAVSGGDDRTAFREPVASQDLLRRGIRYQRKEDVSYGGDEVFTLQGEHIHHVHFSVQQLVNGTTQTLCPRACWSKWD